MIFYIKLMTCIILTGLAFAVFKIVLEIPIYRLKHSLKFKSFRRKNRHRKIYGRRIVNN